MIFKRKREECERGKKRDREIKRGMEGGEEGEREG